MQTEHSGILAAGVDSTDTLTGVVGAFLAEHFIDQIHPQALDVPLSYCLPELDKALSRTDDYNRQDLIDMLYAETATLFIEWAQGRPQCCMVITVVPMREGQAAHIMAIANFPGKSGSISREGLRKLGKVLKEEWGCSHIQGWAQEPVARLWQRLDFKEVTRLVRKEL